jgi:small-conductance mechanosensitive channel
MPIPPGLSQVMREFGWQHLVFLLAIFVVARLLIAVTRWTLVHAAERAPASSRLRILRIIPVLRVVIGAAALLFAIPVVIEPTLGNVIALASAIGIALAFTLKDYASSLAGGLTAILENTYQPGDWIEIDGVYGEVTRIANRAVHIVTPDDTEVIIPHAQLWSKSVFNATSGKRSLLCVADFYLDPNHDEAAARERLAQVAESSEFRKAETAVTVIVHEKPWGTHYRLKAYAEESRQQFLFTTDLTLRGRTALRAINVRFAQAPVAVTASA